jgi:hypothetical protein
MLFGSGPRVTPLDSLRDIPLGTRLKVGVGRYFWIGNYAGTNNGVLLLSNARLFSDDREPIGSTRALVRIPCRCITFLAEVRKRCFLMEIWNGVRRIF